MKLPAGLGQEAAGVVEAVGAGVTGFKVGDRVAYAGLIGAYAESTSCRADRVAAAAGRRLDETAAASLLKGMTADSCCAAAHPVRPGETILVHAAAGGVGLILASGPRRWAPW